MKKKLTLALGLQERKLKMHYRVFIFWQKRANISLSTETIFPNIEF